MLTIIILTLLFIAVTISFICVVILSITESCYMKQTKEYEAEIERLKAAMENAASKESI